METKIQKGKLTISLGSHGDNNFEAVYDQESRTLRTTKNGESIATTVLDEDVSLHEFMNLLNTKYSQINN